VEHRLDEIGIIHIHPDREQEWRWLIEKYGAPTEHSTRAYQNAFGARWECASALWKLPNGEGVVAEESMAAGNQVWLAVDFLSREAMLRPKRTPEKPNPY
jgi:hypothetical protein